MRRCWCVVVSFSQVFALPWAMLVRMTRTVLSRSSRSHLRAQSYPRRAPVVIASHTNTPHGRSVNAALRIAAACWGVGGWGSCITARGDSASLSGLTLIHRQRIARFRAPLRQKCTCRIDEAARGRHLCGLHSSVHLC
jgi:hypothetical protein